MKQDEIIQQIIGLITKEGVNTTKILIRRLELLDEFNSVRSKTLSDFMIADYEISNRNYQVTLIDKEDVGDETFNYFIQQPTVMGKISSVGSQDNHCRFTECTTAMDFQSDVLNQVPSDTYYYPESGYLKVSNTNVTIVREQAIFTSPHKLPTFNPDYDEYPIDDALIPQLCVMVASKYYQKPIQNLPTTKDLPKANE